MEILKCVLLGFSVVTCSVLKSRMPLLDSMRAPLLAELDVSLVNQQLKEYIDTNVENQVNDHFNKTIRDLLKQGQSEINLKMLEQYSTEFNKTQVTLIEQFKSQSPKFEQEIARLQNSVQELKKTRSEDKTGGIGSGTNRPIDCGEINIKLGSGSYRVYPKGSVDGFYVYCDRSTDNIYGGWTVFQRRLNGDTDFYRGLEDYKMGFGDVNKEFWLGNRNLHELTSQGHYNLRVVIEDFKNKICYAQYGTFFVGDEFEKYKLTVANYSGTAGDSLRLHNSQSFSTKDRDNDNISGNCAKSYKGGWWYNSCHRSNLNGIYHNSGAITAKGITWYFMSQKHESMKKASMMIRRQN